MQQSGLRWVVNRNVKHGSAPQFFVPTFVTITEVTETGATDPEFVISNEATGKYFTADRATVLFLEAINRTKSVTAALRDVPMIETQVKPLLGKLRNAGVLVQAGDTVRAPAPKSPIEGKLISLRRDLINAAGAARLFAPLGRFLFSPVGYMAWVIAIFATLAQLITNSDKVLYSLRQLPDQSVQSLILLVLIYSSIKAIHEMGPALAYQRFCQQADLDPGPIRMGIAVFAMTPFPFTDVTGAWRLRSRFQRVMIGAGGMYIETWMIAILTAIWANVQAGPIQSLILQVVVISGAMTLAFNLNPAVKLDGYYMLTDAIRRPNLAARSRSAALHWMARRFGGEAVRPDPLDLGYWLIAYAYRWTIFAGIFWLAYRFDPNLAYAVLAVTTMMLIVRPIIGTFKYLAHQRIKPARAIIFALLAGGFGLLLFVPLPDRVLVPGHYLTHETRFIEPPETGRLSSDAGGLQIDNPQLSEERTSVTLRRIALENTLRSVSVTAVEQARLQRDVERLVALEGEIAARMDRSRIDLPETQVWTPMAAETYGGAWVLAASDPLGALSRPVDPYIRLRVPQTALQQGLELDQGVPVGVRFVHDGTCDVAATLRTALAQATLLEGNALLRATFEDTDCTRGLRSGAAVVARIEAPAKSILVRARTAVARLLQDRLPVTVASPT